MGKAKELLIHLLETRKLKEFEVICPKCGKGFALSEKVLDIDYEMHDECGQVIRGINVICPFCKYKQKLI